VPQLVLDAQRSAAVFASVSLPSRLLNAVFLTWLQGWVTLSRFQAASSCFLCGNFMSSDSVRHLATCPIQQTLADTYLGLFSIGHTSKHFLCPEDEHPLILQTRALHLYIFKKTYDFCRVHNMFVNSQNVSNVYRNFLIEICGDFPRLRRPCFKFSVTNLSEHFLLSDFPLVYFAD